MKLGDWAAAIVVSLYVVASSTVQGMMHPATLTLFTALSWGFHAGIFYVIGRWDAVVPLPGDPVFLTAFGVGWLRGRLTTGYGDLVKRWGRGESHQPLLPVAMRIQEGMFQALITITWIGTVWVLWMAWQRNW